MKRRKVLISLQLLGIWFITILPTACVDEIELNSIGYERLLVVDGNISDQSKTHEIFLSYTSPIDDNKDASEPVTGATVWVEDDEGNRTNFTEHNAGSYLSPINFAGTVGRSYALFISTTDGGEYQSSFQELKAAPEIDRIYNRFAVKEYNQTAETIAGAQFFIDVENAGASTGFYRYEWTDVHQVIARYIKMYDAEIQPSGQFVIVPFDQDVRECYRESRFNEVIVATSTTNANGQLLELPIKFTPANTFDVTTMYSIEVTQRAISSEAFDYYRQIELFNESNGSLFDKQPGVIVGNVRSINSPDEKVLGLFEVSGSSSKRVFLELSDLDPEVYDNIYRTCPEFGTIEFNGSINDFYFATDISDPDDRQSAIVYRSVFEVFDLLPDVVIMAHRTCVDCRYRGTQGKPDYWP